MSLSVNFQTRVAGWLEMCFGVRIARDKQERNHRFAEEAIELTQALGMTASEWRQLIDYVYGRPVGDPEQEVGGTMVTLAALCAVQGLDMDACGSDELDRCWKAIDKIRFKQTQKPKFSPLPAVDRSRELSGAAAAVVRAWEQDLIGGDGVDIQDLMRGLQRALLPA